VKVLFAEPKAVVAMIHVGALPGTPRWSETLEAIVEQAREEARVYAQGGVDGLMIENMHDVPYLRGTVGPEIIAAMTAVGGCGESSSRCMAICPDCSVNPPSTTSSS